MDLKQTKSITLYIFMIVLFISVMPAKGAEAKNDRKWSIKGGIRYSLLTPAGKMGISSSGNVSQTDLSDLGLDSAEGTWGISIGGNYGRPTFFFSAQTSAFSGSGTTSTDMSKGPVTIPAGTPVQTDMDIGIYTLIGTYDLIQGKYELGVGLGLMGLDFAVNYQDLNTGAQINMDEMYPMPLIAVNGTLHWKKLELDALLGGAYLPINDSTVAYLNADIAARYPFYKSQNWAGLASLGYRYIGMMLDIEKDGDRFEADITFTGPYIGARIDY